MARRRRKLYRAGAALKRAARADSSVEDRERATTAASTPDAHAGHNNGPPLDEDRWASPRYCKYCRHWSAPADGEVRAYEAFRLGLSRRRVRRPSGACDRVLLREGKPLAFSATVDTFSCLNFSAMAPSAPVRGRGYVMIY